MTHTDIAFQYFQPYLLRHFDHFLIRIFICGLFQTQYADVMSPPILLVRLSVEQQGQFGVLVYCLGRYIPEPRDLGCRTEPSHEGSLHATSWYALAEQRWNPGRTLVSIRPLPCAPKVMGRALLLVFRNGSSFGLWGHVQTVLDVYRISF